MSLNFKDPVMDSKYVKDATVTELQEALLEVLVKFAEATYLEKGIANYSVRVRHGSNKKP